MIVALLLFVVGVMLSALFSGTETGFYRVTRMRLLLDSLGGDPLSRSLLWMANNPALFVATALVGNNLANYVTSYAIVLGTNQFVTSTAIELLAPILLSPIVFVYGELLPKNLFYYAPNRLLRQGAPVFLFFAVLFSPVSAVLWALGRLLQFAVGTPPLRFGHALARRELQQALQEGQEAGILRPAQRDLAQNLFSIASRQVGELCTPASRIVTVQRHAQKREVYRLARRQKTTVIPVTEEDSRRLAGYVRIVDLYLDEADTITTVRPLIQIHARESHIAALIRLQTAGEELACVVDGGGEMVGLLLADELTNPLFSS